MYKKEQCPPGALSSTSPTWSTTIGPLLVVSCIAKTMHKATKYHLLYNEAGTCSCFCHMSVMRICFVCVKRPGGPTMISYDRDACNNYSAAKPVTEARDWNIVIQYKLNSFLPDSSASSHSLVHRCPLFFWPWLAPHARHRHRTKSSNDRASQQMQADNIHNTMNHRQYNESWYNPPNIDGTNSIWGVLRAKCMPLKPNVCHWIVPSIHHCIKDARCMHISIKSCFC